MRVPFLTTLVLAACACTAAAAQPGPPDSAVLCLDGLGVNHPAICHTNGASRLESKPDICSCRGPYQQVRASWCAKGEEPPADTAAFDRARLAAVHDGSLVGFTYMGKRACVPMGPNG